jgi:hypothetical protein
LELELELTRSGGRFPVRFSNHLRCPVSMLWFMLAGIELGLLAPLKVQG